MTILLLLAALAITDGPEPFARAAGVGVKVQVSDDLILLPSIDEGEPGGFCSGPEISACWTACGQQILGEPYCTQAGTWCQAGAGGQIQCHCSFFCIKDSGGEQHKPKRLMEVQLGGGDWCW